MGRMWEQLARLTLLGGLALACNQSDFGDDLPPPPEGPGHPSWGDPDVSCQSSDDCGPAEECIESVCQMARCNHGPYRSAAPLGAQRFFFHDREIIAADDMPYQNAYWIDGYFPGSSSMTYPAAGSSWNVGNKKVVDIAGGNFLGQRPEQFAIAHENSSSVVIRSSTGTTTIPLGFQPVAIAAGDIYNDGLDELVALSASGRVALCAPKEGNCKTFQFQGVTGIDVAVADIDADFHAEPIFLFEVGNRSEIIAWNVDHEKNNQPEIVGFGVNTKYLAMAAGDVDGDGIAEVLLLEDGGWFGFAKNHIHIWRVSSEPTQLGTRPVARDTRAILVSDLDRDGADEVVLLGGTRRVDVFRTGVSGQLDELYSAELSVTQSPRRIAAADIDGNSPAATMVSSGPDLVSGEVVPTMVIHWPPYSRTHADGIPYVFVGETGVISEFYSDTVGLRAGIEFGYGAEFPLGLLGSEISARVNEEVRRTQTIGQDTVVGNRFVITPDLLRHGTDYSVVMLTSACYHAYRYQLEDPDDFMGGNGAEFVLMVPVGGNHTIWSSKRYDAMAQAVGGMPQVGGTFEIGDLAGYPTSPARPNGEPVLEDELVFLDWPTYIASDVAKVGWWLAVAERTINEVATYTDLSVNAHVKLGGFKFGGEVARGFGTGLGIQIGHEAIFGGAIPPIPDNPNTPEDEYKLHNYSFGPYVYREKYEDAEGGQASYYVLSYAVGN
jgi:hypothetical protein